MQCSSGAGALVVALALAAPVQAQPNITAQARLQIAPAPDSARMARKGGATLFAIDVPATNRPLARGRTMLFGGWQPNDSMMIGVGLFSIPKSATANPYEARIDPMKDTSGKTSRVAAVGMSFRF